MAGSDFGFWVGLVCVMKCVVWMFVMFGYGVQLRIYVNLSFNVDN